MPYFHKQYHLPGTPPGTLTQHAKVLQRPLSIRLIDYNETEFTELAETTPEVCQRYLDSTNVTWIHLQGYADPSTLRAIGETFGLHSLAMEDVLNIGQRPKVEEYDHQLFMIMSLPVIEDDTIAVEQVSLFISENLLISFHAGESNVFEPIHQRLQKTTTRIRKHKVDYLLYCLVDLIIDQGFPLLETFGERIEDLEDELLENPRKATLNNIHEIKRELLFLRRMLWPQREVVNFILRGEQDLFMDETVLYFRDCYDHTIQIMDILENYRDMTASMLDVYLSSTTYRLNEIMRVLTVIATIFIPLTFIVGVYGMNFRGNSPWAMPELDWYYGYPLIWGIMLIIAIGMVIYFRRRNWF